MKWTLNYFFSLSLTAIIASSIAYETFAAEHSNWSGASAYKQEEIESHLNEGIELLELGSYRAAAKSFSATLQAIKVNQGINSPKQAAPLALLIQAQMGYRDWRTINQHLAHFEWLNSETYKSDFTSYLQGVESLANLYLQAAADPLNPQAAHYLVSARNLTWNAVSSIERKHGRDSELLSPWLYKIVLSHFYQSGSVKRRGMTSYDYKSDDAVIVNGWSLSKNEYIAKSHSIGLELLARIKDIEGEHRGPESEAIMLIYLGDWEMLFDNQTAALEYYQRGVRALKNADTEPEKIDSFFSHPTVLPEPAIYSDLATLEHTGGTAGKTTFNAWSSNFPAAERPAFSDPKTLNGEKFHAVVQLDKEGNQVVEEALQASSEVQKTSSEKISLMGEKAQLSAQARNKLEENIALLRFRPRFQDGKLVPRDEITVDYFFTQSDEPTILGSN